MLDTGGEDTDSPRHVWAITLQNLVQQVNPFLFLCKVSFANPITSPCFTFSTSILEIYRNMLDL